MVGKEAVKSCALAPDSYIDCFKRDMGSSSARRKIHNLNAPPEVLSAFVLDRLKQDAERRLGPIRQVVITVPAFFDETPQSDARRRSACPIGGAGHHQRAHGGGAGLRASTGKLRRTAGNAADPLRVLVYDLGGGTFDVTILEIHRGRFRTLATDGDVFLGGRDFDERLVGYLAEQFIAAQGVDPRSDPQDAAQLWLDAQEAKHTLSERPKAKVVCFHAGIRMRIEVTRTQFEDLTRDLVQRTATTTSLVVKQAGLDWSQVDRVLLVGGSSRMPMIAQMLRETTGKEPDCSQSPDEAVAHGAALYAGMLMGHRALAEKTPCELINVNSHSLGVVGMHSSTKRVVNVILIPKNTALPCHVVRTFKTARADQRSVQVRVVEGESERPEACIALGECVVRDLPPGLPQNTPVEVEYAYHANGRLSVSARVPSVRYSQHVEIRRNTDLSTADLRTWQMRLCGQPSMPLDPAAATLINGHDQASVVERLDRLYQAVGRLAAQVALPEPLRRSQRSAAAAAELARALASVKEAERARQAVRGSADAIPLEAQLVQAKTELQEAQLRVDFAYLVLGRDCASAGFEPPGAQMYLAEIHALRH